jgi:hypothetical protein
MMIKDDDDEKRRVERHAFFIETSNRVDSRKKMARIEIQASRQAERRREKFGARRVEGKGWTKG